MKKLKGILVAVFKTASVFGALGCAKEDVGTMPIQTATYTAT